MSSKTLGQKQGIYVDIDSLLDTRFGTLVGMGQEVLIGVLDNGYFQRRAETFYGVEKEVFDEAYKKRDKSVLAQSVITKVLGFVNELVREMNTQAIQTPFHTGPKIYINTYPYELNDSEAAVILKAVVKVTNQLSDVILIHKEPKALTPQYCDSNFAVMFMYDYAPFLEAQGEAFVQKRCPSLSVFVPGIYFVREPTAEELSSALETRMHPIKEMELISAPMIGLKLYEIELFCANIPQKTKSA